MFEQGEIVSPQIGEMRAAIGGALQRAYAAWRPQQAANPGAPPAPVAAPAPATPPPSAGEVENRASPVVPDVRLVHYINEATPRAMPGNTRAMPTQPGEVFYANAGDGTTPLTPAAREALSRPPRQTPEMRALAGLPVSALGHALPAMIAATRAPRTPMQDQISGRILAIHESALQQALAAARTPQQQQQAYQNFERGVSPYALHNSLGTLGAAIRGDGG